MKKLILVLLVLVGMVSCDHEIPLPKNNIQTNNPMQSDILLTTAIYDSCEYVLSDVQYGNSITHKGNCKFCLIRNK